MFDILLIYFLDLVEAAFKKCQRQFISDETKSVLLIAKDVRIWFAHTIIDRQQENN